MTTLDTNVLVRLLVDDDPVQRAAAVRLVNRCTQNGQSLFVPLTVALELEWVLRSRYRFSKESIVATLASLLETRELLFQDESAVEHALHCYRGSNADFAECLHLGCATVAGQLPLETFDKQAARLDGARLLS